MNSESDAIFLLGDFNSRIGTLSDTLNEIDDLCARIPIDKTINQHGHEMIEFLIESKFCVLNGRFAEKDNFTSISKKRKAVVDYLCVSQDIFV